jgi:hypothetical protein
MRAYCGYSGVGVPRTILVTTSYEQCKRRTVGGVAEINLDSRYFPLVRNGALCTQFDKGYLLLKKALSDAGVLPSS